MKVLKQQQHKSSERVNYILALRKTKIVFSLEAGYHTSRYLSGGRVNLYFSKGQLSLYVVSSVSFLSRLTDKSACSALPILLRFLNIKKYYFI